MLWRNDAGLANFPQLSAITKARSLPTQLLSLSKPQTHRIGLPMPSPQPLTAASSTMLRRRLASSLRRRGGAAAGPSRWTSPGHEERPKGYLFNRTPPPPGQARKWEDWELPCYITSFLTIVTLGVGLNAKPDLTIETWAHQKAIERLESEKLALSTSSDSE